MFWNENLIVLLKYLITFFFFLHWFTKSNHWSYSLRRTIFVIVFTLKESRFYFSTWTLVLNQSTRQLNILEKKTDSKKLEIWDCSFYSLFLFRYTGWSKNNRTDKRFDISLSARGKELIFIPVIRARINFISMKACVGKAFVECYCRPQNNIFIVRKKGILPNKIGYFQ